jgi:hypothetical protein
MKNDYCLISNGAPIEFVECLRGIVLIYYVQHVRFGLNVFFSRIEQDYIAPNIQLGEIVFKKYPATSVRVINHAIYTVHDLSCPRHS